MKKENIHDNWRQFYRIKYMIKFGMRKNSEDCPFNVSVLITIIVKLICYYNELFKVCFPAIQVIEGVIKSFKEWSDDML